MILVKSAVHRAGMQVTWACKALLLDTVLQGNIRCMRGPPSPYFILTYPAPAPGESGAAQSRRADHLGAWRAAAGWCAPGPAAWWRACARAPCGRQPRAPRPPPPAGPRRTSSSVRPARVPRLSSPIGSGPAHGANRAAEDAEPWSRADLVRQRAPLLVKPGGFRACTWCKSGFAGCRALASGRPAPRKLLSL